MGETRMMKLPGAKNQILASSLSLLNKLKLAVNNTQRNKTISGLALVTFLTQIPNFYGEDIVNARENYLTGAKTDFWGGFSTLIYGHIPNIWPRWQIWLALMQVTFTCVGLTKFFQGIPNNRRNKIAVATVAYASLMFAAQMTRDGLMFSALLLGLAILQEGIYRARSVSYMLPPTLLICLALSLRPWMALAVIPVLLSLLNRRNKNTSKFLTASLVLIVLITPSVFEIGSSKIMNLVRSYPEQQVMLMDAAASFCYTNNFDTGIRAKLIFQNFTADSAYPLYACQLFRTDTWLSLTNGGNASSQGLSPDFWLISSGETAKYENLKSSWLRMILNDPVTYIQNKILFVQKIMVGSDTRGFQFINEKTMLHKIIALYKIPYEIAISTHLLSILTCLSVFVLFPIFGMFRGKKREIILNKFTLSIMLSLILWAFLSSIAFIGSNGRYTYSITLLSFALILSQSSQNKIPYAKK